MIGVLIVAIVGVVVVLPVVVILTARVLRPLASIDRVAGEIATHGDTLAGHLEPASALLETRKLTQELTGNAVRYVTAIDPMV